MASDPMGGGPEGASMAPLEGTSAAPLGGPASASMGPAVATGGVGNGGGEAGSKTG